MTTFRDIAKPSQTMSILAPLAVLCLCLSGCGSATDTTSKQDPSESDSNVTMSANSNDSANDNAVNPAAEGKPGQVLRHAVFFGFKEGSTDEQIKKVTDAFSGLPAKIDSITDFEWGVNNSPEGLDDGYTHCFLLTFKDNDGRKAYLPHPDHRAFGDVLGEIRDKVFVIDYWGTPSKTPVEKPLRHAVFFKFKDDATADDIKTIEDAFAALPSKIDAIKEFEWGINNSPETKDEGFTHCFMVTFDSEEGRKAYLPHADHLAFVDVLKPVLDKVRVLDFQVEE